MESLVLVSLENQIQTHLLL